MTPIFLDTSYLIALLRRSDALHERAVAWRSKVSVPLLTTEYVIVEFLDSMSAPALRRAACEVVHALDNAPAIEVIPASRSLLSDAAALFARSEDKEWGLTDCASFCVMRARQVRDALTADRHFEQAGFRALLRHEPDSTASAAQ